MNEVSVEESPGGTPSNGMVSVMVMELDGVRKVDEMVVFRDVEPGVYRASLDGLTWTTIVVAASPPTQHVTLGIGSVE